MAISTPADTRYLSHRRTVRALALLGGLCLACGGGGQLATIPPRMEVAARGADFGVVRVGQTVTKSVEVRSLSAATLTLTRVALEGPGASAFALVPPPAGVEALGAASVGVRFQPAAEVEASATLVIESDAADPATATARVALRGRGALPHVRIEAECAPPCRGFVISADPAAIDFGARRPLKRDATGAFVGEPVWPTVRIVNGGEVPLAVHALTFEGDAVFSPVAQLPTGAFEVQPNSSQSFTVRFNPVAAARTTFTGAISVDSDDAQSPRVQLALAGALSQNRPPVVCAAIVAIEQEDGTPGAPTDGQGRVDFFGTPPPVEPGKRAIVYLSAFSDHFVPKLHPDEAKRGDPTLCTTDPDDGRGALRFNWSVPQRPQGSLAQLSDATSPEPSFRPDLVGQYRLQLEVTDGDGGAAQADVAFEARPRRELAVQLTWDARDVDLDLHLVRPGCGGSCVFDALGDLNGYSARAGASFDWGTAGDERDDPMLVWDDQGKGGLLESIYLNGVRDAPACSSATCTYGVYVHYFADGRSNSGSGAVCSGAMCTEGAPCDCEAGLGCVSGHCVSAVHPTVTIYARPADGSSLEVSVPVGSSEQVALAGPCFLWHVADVDFDVDGTAAVRPVGASGSRELLYYGALPVGQFGCTPNGGAAHPASYVPGTAPTYP